MALRLRVSTLFHSTSDRPAYQFLPPENVTSATVTGQYLTVSDAARLLGVHANTVRSWTDQGLLSCLRINQRGDRRYIRHEIERFLAQASAPAGRPTARAAEPHGRAAALCARAGALAATSEGIESAVAEVARMLCAEGGYRAATFVEPGRRAERLVGSLAVDRRLLTRLEQASRPHIGRAHGAEGRYTVAIPVSAGAHRAGTLLLEGSAHTRTVEEPLLMTGIAVQLEMSVRVADRLARATEKHKRAELLVAVSADIGAELDPRRVLGQLVDRAAELFRAEHAAVLSPLPDGYFRARVTRNLSTDFCQFLEHASVLPLTSLAVDQRRIITATNYADDPRAIELRPALIHEGINTATIAPLLSNGEVLGALALYHDKRYDWAPEDMVLLKSLAAQGATVMRNALNYSQMATWAAQLQSIQQLGARLTRLRTVSDIGQTICTELNQLINSHSIRVYRIEGDRCVPVAWRGDIGEYEDEDDEQLRLKVGEGITGWVARYGLAQNLGDAAADRRTQTIPGTEDNLDESLLLAPMLFEDEVLGVIVLAKLGLHQFTADDLRLLEIYASIAAQAMANADTTERLREQSEVLGRQVHSQRELLRVTESILGTLDTQALLEEIAASLARLVEVDNLGVHLYDSQAHALRPIFARGTHARDYLGQVLRDDEGISSIAIDTGEAQLVQDALNDPRVSPLITVGPHAGALIVAPLRSGERIQGLVTIERLGEQARFSDEEFELVKLFAAHVSIALRNAAVHREVEIRAETDGLTGLGNHGALVEQIDRLVADRTRFTMLMVDLDFFKRYNDHYGHQAGNVMLQRVARMLRSACRDTDLLYRYGGDEFAVLLPNTRVTGAHTVAEKVKAAVASLNAPDQPVLVTCSIGVAAFPRDGQDGASVILTADRACYAGKRAGRDRIATAAEGLALASDFEPTEPVQVEAEPSYSVA